MLQATVELLPAGDANPGQRKHPGHAGNIGGDAACSDCEICLFYLAERV